MVGHVLIADDDPDIRLLLESIMSLRGWVVTAAANGVEAVTCAFTGSFDLMVLDHAMPKMTGVEAARNVRLFYRGPIIFYTAYVDDALAREIRQTVPGEVHLISKTDFNGLLSVVERVAAA